MKYGGLFRPDFAVSQKEVMEIYFLNFVHKRSLQCAELNVIAKLQFLLTVHWLVEWGCLVNELFQLMTKPRVMLLRMNKSMSALSLTRSGQA
jgi:hypothetical protein